MSDERFTIGDVWDRARRTGYLWDGGSGASDVPLYRLADTNLYRYHRERRQCEGVFTYTTARPLICPGCNGRWQGNAIERTRRRLRDWLMQP